MAHRLTDKQRLNWLSTQTGIAHFRDGNYGILTEECILGQGKTLRQAIDDAYRQTLKEDTGDGTA